MKRALALATFALVFGATVAQADDGAPRNSPPSPSSPKARQNGIAKATPAAPNAYVVSDPADPYVLHPAPDFAGFDAGYVEMFARPHVTPSTQQRAKPAVKLQAPVDLPGPNPYLDASATVLVLAGTSDEFNPQTGEFDAAGNGLFNVAQQVLGEKGDVFDFIAIYSTVDSQSSNFAAFYLPLVNDVKGLGDCNPGTQETFGCQFNQLQNSGIQTLQGLLFMNSPKFWQDWDSQVDGTVHDFTSFDSNAFAVLGQETAHRWGAALRFKDPRNGQVSKKLLGRDLSHWAAYVDTDASVMDGWDWSPPKSGRFDLTNDMDVFSTLDLYSMGALPVAAAKPFFFIDNATYDVKGPSASFLSQLQGRAIGAADVLELGLPSVKFMSANGVDMGAKGTEVDLSIQDIVNAEGNRCPDPDHTQRAFRQAIVLVTKPGDSQAVIQQNTDAMNQIAATWEKWFSDRTHHALTLCTTLDPAADACKQAVPALGGGNIDSKGGKSFIERGETATLHMTVTALEKYPTPRGDAAGADLVNAHVVLSLDSAGASHAKLASTDVKVGAVKAGQVVDVPVDLTIDGTYECGTSLIVVAQLEADNAPTVVESYRLFPGYRTDFLEDFGTPGDSFKVNDDGQDGQKGTGKLTREDVELSCLMSPRTPETDNTPGSKGAYVTSVAANNDGSIIELTKDTSLWSPDIDLSKTASPELAYDFWLQGDPGDSLLVQLSSDGKNFVKADEIDDASLHGWGLRRIVIADVFKGSLPKSVTARWIFNGHGHLEGGIDNVRLLDPQGQCQAIVAGFCGCTTDGGSSPQSAVAMVLGLLGLRIVRKRAR